MSVSIPLSPFLNIRVVALAAMLHFTEGVRGKAAAAFVPPSLLTQKPLSLYR